MPSRKTEARRFLNQAKRRVVNIAKLSEENPSYTSDPLRAEIEMAQLQVWIALAEHMMNGEIHVVPHEIESNSWLVPLETEDTVARDMVSRLEDRFDRAIVSLSNRIEGVDIRLRRTSSAVNDVRPWWRFWRS